MTNEVKILNMTIHDLGKRNGRLKRQIKALKQEIEYLESNLKAITINKPNTDQFDHIHKDEILKLKVK